jgi:hypothetical protein
MKHTPMMRPWIVAAEATTPLTTPVSDCFLEIRIPFSVMRLLLASIHQLRSPHVHKYLARSLADTRRHLRRVRQ